MKRLLGLLDRKQRGLLAAAGVLPGLVLAGSLGMASRPRTGEPSPPADVVAANGTVEGARRTAELRPEVVGTLAVLHARVGRPVSEGALLFELNNRVQQERVSVARAQVKLYEAQLKQARSDWERTRGLINSRATTSEKYDEHANTYLAAQARLEEAQAQLHLAEAELAKTQVRVPWSGVVVQTSVEPGVTIGPGSSRPVVRFADVSRKRVRASVEERNVGRVRPGQRAVVTTDTIAFQGKEFTGRVAEVAGIMGQTAPQSDDPEEQKDLYFFEVVIDLEGGEALPLNHRVRVTIHTRAGN